jgi:hypothetical protein
MMKKYTTVIAIIGLVSLYSVAYAESQEKQVSKQENQSINDDNKRQDKKANQQKKYLKLSYAPPFLGSPSNNSRLIGMALRGSGVSDLLLSVLAPAHTGLSSTVQPDIYWYTSKPISKPFQFIEFVLNSDRAIKPVVRTHLKPVTQGGIQKLSLSDYNIKLDPDIEYTWVISLVPDATSRAHDFVTSGKIKHVKPNQELRDKIRISSTQLSPYIFAQAGYWYDALAATIHQTETQTNEVSAKENLVSLLEQVELNQIAKMTKDEGGY